MGHSEPDPELDYESAVLTLGERGPRVLCCLLKSDVDADRSKLFSRKNVHIVMQVRSTGQIVIVFGWEVAKNSQTDVLKILRVREHETEKPEIKRYDWRKLSVTPELYGWQYDSERGMISTSGLSALSVDEIVSCVRLALNAGQFEPERAWFCHQGICHSRERDECSYYRFGLSRCKMIRDAAQSAAENDEE